MLCALFRKEKKKKKKKRRRMLSQTASLSVLFVLIHTDAYTK